MTAPPEAAPRPVVAVAYSGGRDSTALLHACARQATALGLRTVALHVHHGLLPEAQAWWTHAQRTCRRWARQGLDLTFVGLRLEGAPSPGESVEAWAREQRYRALSAMARAQGASLVLLAHHAQDQAETVLLQALRGAGVKGWAAMPAQVEREGLTWARPWLGQPPQALAAYARRHRLAWVEDPSNADPRHARSRLRQAVWPALLQAFPSALATLGDAARWAQDAADNQAQLAAIDLAALHLGPDRLDLDAWLALPPSRARNALRHWLWAQGGAWPSAALVQRLDRELRQGRGPARWQLPGAGLQRYRGELRHRVDAPPSSPGPGAGEDLQVDRPGRYPCPGWGGSLIVAPAATAGVTAGPHRWRLQARDGGERFQLGPGRPPRSLKKQYQARGLAASDRSGPLVWEDGQLLAVPGLGVDARRWAPPGNEQWSIAWEADPAT